MKTHIILTHYLLIPDDSEYDDDEVEEQEDENSEDGFMQFYSDALNEELTATTLRKSFLHARKQANNINAVIPGSIFQH